MTYTIETTEIVKRYRALTAVDQISLQVNQGEIYAFLGLNGAGKTTTIRMLLGMIRPTSGSIRVLGTAVKVGHRQPWDSVGYLVETPHAYPELTVKENLEVARSLHPGIEQKAVSDIIEVLGLSHYADKRAGHLSLGNVQRLGLAKAFLHQPKVLFLDEPSNGLDPAGIVEIREYLRGLASEHGATIFMSSHLLGEVSKVAHRVGIIHQGRLLQEMKVGELQQQQSRRLVVRTRANDRAKRLLADAGIAFTLIGQEDSIQNLLINDGDFLENPDKIAAILVAGDAPPTHLVVEEEELEGYFLRLVGQENQSATSTTRGRE